VYSKSFSVAARSAWKPVRTKSSPAIESRSQPAIVRKRALNVRSAMMW
jgi:hypothetical protein